MSVASFNDVLERLATKGVFVPGKAVAQGSGTNATATGGFLNVIPIFNAIGSTVPTTLVSTPVPNATDAPLLLANYSHFSNVNRGITLGWFYEIGTLNVAATGDQFTHHAATLPLLRTRMGEASQPVPLMPFLWLTTALTTTAAIFTIKNGANSTGYVNQAGSTVVGTKTFTFPSTTTAVQTGLLLALEDTDYAIRDIQQINVGTAAATGAATIFGFEPLFSVHVAVAAQSVMRDMLGEALTTLDMRPAVATSGTATAYFGGIAIGHQGTASGTQHWNYFACKND